MRDPCHLWLGLGVDIDGLVTGEHVGNHALGGGRRLLPWTTGSEHGRNEGQR
jgi:hypothetical protein